MLSGGLFAATALPMVEQRLLARVAHLNGTLRGRYTEHIRDPDIGLIFDLAGSGRVRGLGRSFVTGQITGIGFIASGRAEGTLFLANVHGTLTLGLTGPLQFDGPRGLPDFFAFKTEGGTGRYRNVSATGTASLVTIPGPSIVRPFGTNQGTFTLVLTARPIPSM
jgi:hypothetical protein